MLATAPPGPTVDLAQQSLNVGLLKAEIGTDRERAIRAMHAAEGKMHINAQHENEELTPFSYNYQMPEVAPKTTFRRPRLLWTLLGAMVLVGLLPLVVSHYFLIGINRDSLETPEKKYLTRSAVSIAGDVQNLLTSNMQQLTKIAGSIRIMRKTLPPGTDPFT